MATEEGVIIFVDDQKICHSVTRFLSLELECQVFSAYIVEDAMEIAKQFASELCLIITDVMLPGEDGTEIYKKVRNDKKFRSDLPVIFQSGLSDISQINKNDLDENAKIIYKPYKQEDLIMLAQAMVYPEQYGHYMKELQEKI